MFVNRIQRLSEVLHFGLGRQATTVDADKTYAYDLRGRKTYEGGATYPVRSAYDVFGNYNPRGELILALSFQGELRR